MTKCHDAKIGRNSQDQFLRLAQNTYKTLLSRGMKGVFVYSVDKDTRDYLKRRLKVVKDIDKTRFYNKKLIDIQELFLGERLIAAETYGSYSADLVIRVENNFNIKPIANGYYYCDILDEQIFFDKLKDALRNSPLELTEFVEVFIKDAPQIRNYARSVKGVTIDAGILRFEPIVFVKRLCNGKEMISMIFKSQQLN